MNEVELKNLLTKRGYRKVTVKGFSKSTRIHAETRDWSEVRNLGVSLADIDLKWIDNHYPSLVDCVEKEKGGKE